MEKMSQEARKKGHCSRILIDGLIYLKLTQGVIQSRNAANINGSQPDWDARESRARATQSHVVRAEKPTVRRLRSGDDGGDGTG
jgi:hypothetical protein